MWMGRAVTRPSRTNPIRVGDKAYALSAHGEIAAVNGDLVAFRWTGRGSSAPMSAPAVNQDWRHWTSCFYDCDVIRRVMAKTKTNPYRTARLQQLAPKRRHKKPR